MPPQPTLYGSEDAAAGGLLAMMGAFWFLYFIFAVLMIIAMWRIFSKAGEPGWAAIIPIYNVIVLLKVVGRPWWWLLLMLIPVVNLVIVLIVTWDLSLAFGHGAGMFIGLLLLPFIFYLVLAFGSSTYQRGGSVAPAMVGAAPPVYTPPPSMPAAAPPVSAPPAAAPPAPSEPVAAPPSEPPAAPPTDSTV
jgi:hypothetical protein